MVISQDRSATSDASCSVASSAGAWSIRTRGPSRPADPDLAPTPVDPSAQQAFETAVRAAGLDPSNRWVGGYVDYEWRHLPLILSAYQIDPRGLQILEFGSNIGGSAIVLSYLGAQVHGVDVDPSMVHLARLNAARYGRGDTAFSHVPDTRVLPFADATFDLISCNSVLEYIAPELLGEVQRELDRVLKPGGLLLVTGTCSRLWPYEVHHRRWLVNWLPLWVDRLLFRRQRWMRGVWPWTVRNGFGPGYLNLDALDQGRAFLAARARMNPRQDTVVHHAIAWLAARLGVGPGLLMNNLSCLLKKGERP